jgi:hypothetical protein
MRYFGYSTAGDERRLGTESLGSGTLSINRIGFTRLHAERSARSLV